MTVPAPGAAGTVAERVLFETDFDEQVLPPEFQWLRTPVPERIFSLAARTGHLRLFGRESIGSWFEQALVARRQEHHSFRAEAVVDFAPDTYQQVAGLTHYYNRHKFHALGVTRHETLGRVLTILSCPGDFPNGRLTYPVGSGFAVPDGPVQLAMEVRDNDLQFFWRGAAQAEWLTIGPVLDAGVISDEGGRGEHGSFTGRSPAFSLSTSRVARRLPTSTGSATRRSAFEMPYVYEGILISIGNHYLFVMSRFIFGSGREA